MRASTFAAYSGFCITSDSVTSSFSVSGATPVRASTAFTSLMRSWRRSWRLETLIETKGSRVAGQRRLPGGELARRVLQHVEAELHDQPALLGGGDEVGRRDAAVQRMLPARQRLEAGDGVVGEADDRLVDDVEAAASSALRSSVSRSMRRLRVPNAGS